MKVQIVACFQLSYNKVNNLLLLKIANKLFNLCTYHLDILFVETDMFEQNWIQLRKY